MTHSMLHLYNLTAILDFSQLFHIRDDNSLIGLVLHTCKYVCRFVIIGRFCLDLRTIDSYDIGA